MLTFVLNKYIIGIINKAGDFMARRKLSERQEMKVRSDRSMEVYKRSDMLQKGRHELTLQEQRCVLYAISKIKPEDEVFQEYQFEISDFYRMCGLQNESYTDLKAILKGLSDRSWWVETAPNEESTVRWFQKVRTNKKSGTVTIRFDDDMMPYLLELSKQNEYFTHYQLKYILPMRSQYAIRLYEILKSYQFNNREWFFEVEALRKQLNCSQYDNFKDFRRRVIEPAVVEINEFSDIKVAWEPIKEGRKVVRVVFYMVGKSKHDLIEAEMAGRDQIDGQIELEDILAEYESSVKRKFFKENQGE